MTDETMKDTEMEATTMTKTTAMTGGPMTIKEAIDARHSVRKYQDRPIERELVDQLKQLIDECNQQSGLNIQLVLDAPECFKTLLGHYMKFEGTVNYIALIGKSAMQDLDEICGYYGQRLVLEAQRMGLNTCWVAGTYSKGKCQATLAADEKIVCVISIGYGQTQGTEHRSKPLSKVCDLKEEEMPDWFRDGVDAALKAPTAMNQQRFFVTLKKGEPVITAKRGPLTKIDLGIVKYNFEAASGRKCK